MESERNTKKRNYWRVDCQSASKGNLIPVFRLQNNLYEFTKLQHTYNMVFNDGI